MMTKIIDERNRVGTTGYQIRIKVIFYILASNYGPRYVLDGIKCDNVSVR